MNLPAAINFSNGNKIELLYDPAGNKLQKTVKTGATTNYTQYYIAGLEYRADGAATAALEAIYHKEGRIKVGAGPAFQYEYAIRDHLGNTRLTFADLNDNKIIDVPADILQESHYYPFGLTMNYGWLNNSMQVDNRYQYVDKEWNDDWGLNWYDYNNRWYDPAVSRFFAVDKLADKFPYLTPYQYASNMPTGNIDLDGLEAVGADGRAALMNQFMAGASADEAAKQNRTEKTEAAKAMFAGAATALGEGLGAAFAPALGKLAGPLLRVFGRTDEAAEAASVTDKALDAGKALDKAGDAAKTTDKAADVAKAGGEVVEGGAKGGATVLEGAVKSNYGRFINKIPANSKSSATFQALEDGNYLFSATSPGRVPGSSALYQKWVNAQGETFKMLKTTFAPDGSIIHVKPKF